MGTTRHPREELERAREAIEQMNRASSFDEFEAGWIEFLNRLERIWSKSKAAFEKHSSWNGWKGRYLKLRKKDPLLSYLINARGAEVHTVEPIAEKEDSTLSFGAGPTGSVHIKEIRITNGRLLIDADAPVKVTFRPERMKLLPITNRGRVYDIPREHNGSEVNPDDVLALARLALGFYEAFLQDADAYLAAP